MHQEKEGRYFSSLSGKAGRTMKILVTGAKGFIGRNLITELNNHNHQVYSYDIDSDPKLLETYCKEVEFVYHLAGVNRPQKEEEYMEGNYGFTSKLLKTLTANNNNCTIVNSSSLQAELNNPYGISKKAGEELVLEYGFETGAKVLIYRFPNVFGKWCRPNYNSAIATFSYNIARGLPIVVHDPNVTLNLVYIDDVVKELLHILDHHETSVFGYRKIPVEYHITLGEIVELLYSFEQCRVDHTVPDMSEELTKKLYSTYLSYLPEKKLNYELDMRRDNRGSFTEFLKLKERGQVSINISKPGIVKGNHWHHTKCEKFMVVSGSGVVRLRRVDTDQIVEYYVSGEKLEVIDIPVGYTHQLVNTGTTELVTVIWVNEYYDPENPDTYYLEV
jgi:UDP-2-acetamido-2,6-beta-L-arabino-hexul-4-ose reductase